MNTVIHFAGSCVVHDDTKALQETEYALYHTGLFENNNVSIIEVTCGELTQNRIVTQTRREADLLGNGILALIDNAYKAQNILNGGCSEANNAIEEYVDELRGLLKRIGSLEKESDE